MSASDASGTEALERLESDVRGWLQELAVPGVSATVFSGLEAVWSAACGTRSADTDDSVTGATPFQAASASKLVTAALALNLVARGELRLDRDVNEQLASWRLRREPDASAVTLRHLLSHTAGLTVPWFPGYQHGQPVPVLRQVLSGEPPANTDAVVCDTEPGTAYRYSGGGYAVVQQLLVDCSGAAFEQLAREHLFGPLGMTDSSFVPQPAGDPLPAVGHDADGRPIEGRWRIQPEQAAAGLWTTSADLARFAIAICRSWRGEEGAYLPASLAHEMLAPAITSSEPAAPPFADIGLGAFLKGHGDALCFGHTGGNEGYRSLLFAFPALGGGATILTNGNNGWRVWRRLASAAGAALGWPHWMDA